MGDDLTISAGVRFDHSRAVSQDLHALDPGGRETDRIIEGLGTLYSWNLWSPRLGATMKLTGDGRTILRGSYGRFSPGVLTGEFSAFHPGVTPTTTTQFDPVTGGYTRPVSVVDSKKNLLLDPAIRTAYRRYWIGVIAKSVDIRAAAAYIHMAPISFWPTDSASVS